MVDFLYIITEYFWVTINLHQKRNVPQFSEKQEVHIRFQVDKDKELTNIYLPTSQYIKSFHNRPTDIQKCGCMYSSTQTCIHMNLRKSVVTEDDSDGLTTQL